VVAREGSAGGAESDIMFLVSSEVLATSADVGISAYLLKSTSQCEGYGYHGG
jgi:hypothetical protein